MNVGWFHQTGSPAVATRFNISCYHLAYGGVTGTTIVEEPVGRNQPHSYI